MNILTLGSAGVDAQIEGMKAYAHSRHPNDPAKEAALLRKLMLSAGISSMSNVITDTIQNAAPGATPQEINAEVQERLHPTKKTPYLMYAALAAGAYLMFK